MVVCTLQGLSALMVRVGQTAGISSGYGLVTNSTRIGAERVLLNKKYRNKFTLFYATHSDLVPVAVVQSNASQDYAPPLHCGR